MNKKKNRTSCILGSRGIITIRLRSGRIRVVYRKCFCNACKKTIKLQKQSK